MHALLTLLFAIAALFPQPFLDPNAMAGAHAKEFDGTNDYFTHTSSAGFADAKSFTCSLWVKRDGTTNETLIGGQDSTFRWRVWFVSNKLRAIAANTAGTTILQIDSTNSIADTAWHHILVSVDLADTAKRHMYIDDAPETLVVTTYANDTVDFTNAKYGIATVAGTGTSNFDGCLTEIWFADGQYLDLTQTDNRRKFIDPSGLPVYLGADGALPTAIRPTVYIPDANATTNRGDGANFTATGAVTPAPSTPRH